MYLGAATRNKNINPSRSTTKSRDDDVHSRMHSIHAYDEIKVKTDTQIWFVDIFYLYAIYKLSEIKLSLIKDLLS